MRHDGAEFSRIIALIEALAERDKTNTSRVPTLEGDRPKAMFGLAVQKSREARKLTQSELAELSGLSQPKIADIEKGSRVPSLNTMAKLSTALGIIFTVEPHGYVRTQSLPERKVVISAPKSNT
jgi:DNA-binding XRE family transcriptional regulator